VSIFKRLFGDKDERAAMLPLYDAIVAEARQPVWYSEGRAPDTIDGRFDMVAAVLSAVLIRLEGEGERAQVPSVLLTEVFVDDMDGQLRQLGIGDIVVGKHIGKMMSALGGRLSAYREAFSGGDLEAALLRNLYRGETPPPEALGYAATRLHRLFAALRGTAADEIIAGKLPQP
jgi:cytochrome b pre-mRNA-processing protein 3